MRRDIQFLRGIAVLAVVLYHAGFWPLKNGFLGVDIFFVISGFLITTIVIRGIDDNSFSFVLFYYRRAKRLLPALYCTLAITTLIGYVFLTERQWADYLGQLTGAVTFTSNIFLPLQINYFEDLAETKPLLHIWSLSLEEQYYFLLPFILYLVPVKFRSFFLVAAVLASLSLCLFFLMSSISFLGISNVTSSGWAFFLFPTRAWELLMGSAAAWLMLKKPSFNIWPRLKALALLVLCIIFCVSIDDVHPRGDALVAVIATSIMILGRDNWLPINLVTRAIIKIGDFSYSLYLVHWPLFAYATIAFLGDIPAGASATLVALSFILGKLQYTHIEQYFRTYQMSAIGLDLKYLATASVIILLLPFPGIFDWQFQASREDSPNKNFRTGNWGLDSSCDQGDSFYIPLACSTSLQPEIAIWGDSFAMHLVPGLRNDSRIPDAITQLTKSGCAPIVDIARIDDKYSRAWAQSCNTFNRHSLEYIRETQSIRYVILSSPFSAYLQNSEHDFLYNEEVVAQSRELAKEKLVHTINLLYKAKKQPIIIGPPPMVGFNIGECLERFDKQLIVLGREHCDFSLSDSHSVQFAVRLALAKVQEETGVPLVWPEQVTCSNDRCRARIDNINLYRDDKHLSVQGSKLLIPKLNLNELLASPGAIAKIAMPGTQL